MSDDHSSTVLGSYGNDIIRTPNLDRLAAEGMRFTNAYANSPICSASRQSLLTGKYPHATGVNLLFTPFPDKGNETIAEYLSDRNFGTALIGKSHFNDWIWAPLYQHGRPDHGFQRLNDGEGYRQYLRQLPKGEWPSAEIETYDKAAIGSSMALRMNANNLPAPCHDEHCEGTYLARQAIEFMQQKKESRFCLWLAFHEPHQPYAFPVEYRGKYDPDEMLLPPGSAEDDRWVPAIYADMSEKEKRGIIASYYTSVEYMDKNVGLVLDAIDRLGLRENTLVIYLSDHGYLLYEHKRFEKHTMWAEAVKAPLIVRGRGIQAGAVSDALVEFVDVVPTAIEALGLPPMPEVQGSSFMPVLANQAAQHREYVFAEYLEDNTAMLASARFKYIFYTGKKDLGLNYQTGQPPSGIFQRLYNLEKDPKEEHNLAYLPQYDSIVQGFQHKMLQRFRQTHPDAHNEPDNMTTLGKLVWYCEPRDVGHEPGLEIERVFEYVPPKIKE